MSVEQKRFIIDPNYKVEHPPVYRALEIGIEKLRKKPSIPILHFIRQVEKLLKHSPESGSEILFETLLDTALNLWSLRQEMTGEQDTIQVVNNFEWKEKIHHFDLTLEQLYTRLFSYPEWVPWSHRPTYKQESMQVIRRVEQFAKTLTDLDFTKPRIDIENQLLTLGFTQIEIPVTPGLLRHFSFLRNQIHSFTELEEMINSNHTARFWVAPERIISASAPHWLHTQGETSFLWTSDLLISLDGPHPESAVIEHGKFSLTKLPTLLQFLAYGNNEKRSFASRNEVLEYLNVIRGYTDVHPVAFLNQLIQEIGGFIPAKPFDPQVTLGKFPIASFMTEIEKIYRFEWERISADKRYENGLYDRLFYFADLVKQLMASNTAEGLTEVVEAYKTTVFADLDSSSKPIKGASLLENVASQINPTALSKVFDWSKIDCIAGTPQSLMRNLPSDVSQASSSGNSVDRSLPSHQEMINYRLQHDFQTEAEARTFARAFNIPEDWFDKGFIRRNTERIACSGYEGHKCGETRNYIGNCGTNVMCLQCNGQYNLDHGLVDGTTKNQQSADSENQDTTDTPQLVAKKTTGIDGYLLRVMNKKAYEEEFFEQVA